MDWQRPRVRLLIVAGLAILWTGAALGRLAYLQLFRYSEYLDRAERQQQRTVEVSPHRGVIYDRNMHELAMSISVDSCFAVPSEIADPDMVARLLSPALHMTQDEISTKLATSSGFVWIARKIPPEQADRVKEMNLRGIYFIKERKRFYPKRDLAAADLGYVDLDEKGSGGIEYALDSQIRGRPGRMMVLTDAHRRWYQDSTEQGAQAGSMLSSPSTRIFSTSSRRNFPPPSTRHMRRPAPSSSRTRAPARSWEWQVGRRLIPMTPKTCLQKRG